MSAEKAAGAWRDLGAEMEYRPKQFRFSPRIGVDDVDRFIERFEATYSVKLPDDYVKYQRRARGDECIVEALGGYITLHSIAKIVEDDPRWILESEGDARYITFADFLIWSHSYEFAYEGQTFAGVVVHFAGRRAVAETFTEFVRAVVEDDETKLYGSGW